MNGAPDVSTMTAYCFGWVCRENWHVLLTLACHLQLSQCCSLWTCHDNYHYAISRWRSSEMLLALLQESKRNVLKDFVHIAGPLGVTQFLILTATENACYLRVAKAPRVSCFFTVCRHIFVHPSFCPCSLLIVYSAFELYRLLQQHTFILSTLEQRCKPSNTMQCILILIVGVFEWQNLFRNHFCLSAHGDAIL